MRIRKMVHADLPSAYSMCLEAFMLAVAPSLSTQGVETFAKVASQEAFAERMKSDNLIIVCVANGNLIGLVELKEGRHVAMLFVSPDAQRRGIGMRLLNAALEHARTNIMTVRACLPSIPAYEHYGFALAGDVGEFAGLVYQPMDKRLGVG